jgi:hypothetical protein
VSPLTVSAAEGNDHIDLQFKNVGQKNILGYAVILQIHELGRPSRSGTKAVHSVLRGSARENFSIVHKPGDMWVDNTASFRRRGKDRTKKLTIQPTVDYVLFTDGSSWGSDTERRSLLLTGLRRGATAELAHFQTLMRKSEADVVVREIRDSLAGTPAPPVATSGASASGGR